MASAKVWPVADAWKAAVEVTASSYGVDAELLRAESRGRGPKPPEKARWPKKLAVYLTVALSGCQYVALAQHLALHKDTIASHCDSVREACAVDVELEERVDALMLLAATRLGAARGEVGKSREDATVHALLIALHSRFDRLERSIAGAILHPSQTDEAGLHPSENPPHGNVITDADA